MGEIADEIIDAMWDEQFEEESGTFCSYCGEGLFFWGHDGKTMRLFDEKSKPHSCKEYRNAMKARSPK